MTPQQIQETKNKIAKLVEQGDIQSAARMTHQIVEHVPTDLEAWWVYSQLMQSLGQIEQSIRACYQVCQSPSALFEPAVERAVMLSLEFGQWNLGVAPAQEWIKIRPGEAKVWNALATCWFGLKRYMEAIPVLEKVLALDAEHEQARNNLVLCYRNTLQQDKAFKRLASDVESGRATVASSGLLAYLSNFVDTLSEPQVADYHKQFAKTLSQARSVQHKAAHAPKAKKRLGFVSEDFKYHSVAYFFLPIIERFKFDDWEVFCYSCVAAPDGMTSRIQAHCEHWVECASLDHDALVKRILEDELDVLVDLQGITGASRLSVFLSRLATVQLTYLGYPNTTGLSSIDYRLTDRFCDPEDLDESLYAETLYRFEDSFLCYRPDGLEGAVSALPAEKNGFVTFCSFNSIQKYSPSTLSLWADVLKAVPNSKMLIKSAPLFDPLLQQRMIELFGDLGIPKERLILLGWAESMAQHAEVYHQVDIHLDSYPYNGTTTTCESIWQGVPMLAMDAKVHRSRVGLGIMSQLGLDDWVARDREHYVELAQEKASDLAALSALRATIRSKMQHSPLMDEVGFAQKFKNALEGMLSLKRH